MRASPLPLLSALLLALSGCAGDESKDSAPGDSGTDSETDDSSTDDSSTDDSSTSADLTLRFVIDAEGLEGAEIWLAAYHPTAQVVVGEVGWTLSATDAAAGLEVAAPPPGDLELLDPAAPEMMARPTVPALVRGGVVVGIGDHWPTWIEGTIPESYAVAGLHYGWNAIYIDEAHVLHAVDPQALPIGDDLTARDLALSGQTAPPAAQRIALVPEAAMGGAGASLAEAALGGPWQLTTGAPSGLSDDPVLGSGLTALPIGYGDGDGSGAWSAGDTPQHGACAQGQPITARYLAPGSSVGVGLERHRRGLTDGWTALLPDGSPLPDGAAVEAGDGCPVPH